MRVLRELDMDLRCRLAMHLESAVEMSGAELFAVV